MTLPDLNVSDTALQFSVKFFDASGNQVNEDDGLGPNVSSVVTIAPGQSQTFTPDAFNGGVNDDQQADTVHVATCTADFSGGY